MRTLCVELLQPAGWKPLRAVCGAPVSERRRLKGAQPADVRDTDSAAATALRRSAVSNLHPRRRAPHFSPARVSAAFTGVAYFNLLTNALGWAVSVPPEPKPRLGERKVSLFEAAPLCECLQREVFWLKPVNLTSRAHTQAQKHGVTTCRAS